MAVHILRRRVRHDVRAPLERAAVDGRGKRVVHDQRHAVSVRGGGKFFDVEHGQRRVCDRLAEDELRIRAEGRVQLLRRAVRVDKRDIHAHALHRHGEEVVAPAVDARRGDDMVAARGDIEHGKERRRRAGGRQHGRRAALERSDARGNMVVRRVLQAGVEIAVGLEVEELSHRAAGIIFECGALNDGDLPRLAVPRRIARLYAPCSKSYFCHNFCLLPVIYGILRVRPCAGRLAYFTADLPICPVRNAG